jgi:hypothetical protein
VADPTALSDIIDVEVTLQQADVSRDGFAGVMLVSEHAVTSDRVETYTGSKTEILAAMLDAGHEEAGSAYNMARAVLTQRPALATIKIGRKDAGDASWADALDAIYEEDPDWYGLACDTRDATDIEDIAGWADSKFALYVAQTLDADVLTGASGNIAETLADADYSRVALLWHDPETASGADFPRLVSGNAQPFALDNGYVLNIEVDGGAAQTFTFAATAGARTGNQAGPYNLTNNWHLDIQVDGGATQVVTFQTADFGNIAAATLTEVIALVNGDTTGLTASASGGFLRLTSDTKGTASEIEIMNTSTAGLLTALGHTAGSTSGTGDAANIAQATAAEVVTKLAGLTGAAASAGSGDEAGKVVLTGTTKGEYGTIRVTGAAANNALRFSRTLTRGDGSLEDYLDCGLLGARLNADLDGIAPSGGQITWDNVVVRGCYADTLTRAQSSTARGAYVNTYELRTRSRTPGEIHDGRMVNGDWIDARTTADWLWVRLVEDLKSGIDAVSDAGSKIPYTNEGARAYIERTCKARLILAGQSGHIVPDLEPPDPAAGKVTGLTVPTREQQSTAYEADRRWGDVVIVQELAGALHGVVARITLQQ